MVSYQPRFIRATSYIARPAILMMMTKMMLMISVILLMITIIKVMMPAMIVITDEAS